MKYYTCNEIPKPETDEEKFIKFRKMIDWFVYNLKPCQFKEFRECETTHDAESLYVYMFSDTEWHALFDGTNSNPYINKFFNIKVENLKETANVEFGVEPNIIDFSLLRDRLTYRFTVELKGDMIVQLKQIRDMYEV